MVRHCLETTSPFGVVLIRQGREVGAGAISFAGIGTIAEIRDAGSYDDGRYDLLVVGTRRFEIRRVHSGRRPYLVAEVDVLTESIGDPEAAERLAMRATRKFVTYLELLQPRSGETADEIDVRVEIETEDEETGDEDIEEADDVEPRDGDVSARSESEPTAEAAGARPAGGTEDDETSGDEPADPPAARRRRVMIPDDPTVLSHLLAGILQVESPRRQALLEAVTTEDRLRALLVLIDRETFLLQRRLRFFQPDARIVGARRS
jgi:Lon protease-like protein